MNGFFLTNQGKVRDHNEDAGGIFSNSQNQILAVVADGMGGHKAGDVASQMATTTLKTLWEEKTVLGTPEEAERWLEDAIVESNNKIFTHAGNHTECAGMGTTIVAVVCSSDFISVAHIGDSRCYLSNEQGFKQVTEDHSLVNELVRTGQISKQDAEYHPRKNVLLKALGTELDIKPDVQTIGWDKGNQILVCSDGLSNKVTDDELEEYMRSVGQLDEMAAQLISLANERGGEDNISIALVDFPNLAKEGETEC